MKKRNIERPSSKPMIILMTRWPAIFRCKKRLSKDIGPKLASKIQSKLIKHTLSVAKSIEKQGIADIQLAIQGIGPNAAKRWGLNENIKRISRQKEGSLGLKMKSQVLEIQNLRNLKFFANGQPTIFIGTDLPDLCKLDLIQAITSLKRYDLVIGPAFDGGYWLIGFSEKLVNPIVSWPYCGIPWGTNKVLDVTLELAKKEGACYQLLREKNDLDLKKDFFPWQNQDQKLL